MTDLAKRPRRPGGRATRPSTGRSLRLREAIDALRRHYGPPSPPPTADLFELILWESVAYLAQPVRPARLREVLRHAWRRVAPARVRGGQDEVRGRAG